MPTRPLRPCPAPSCPNLTTGGPCAGHRRALVQRRGSAAARGFGRRQQQWSQLILGRDPICRGCNERPSRFADHIIPVPPDQRDAGDWSAENGQGLCPSCDGYKRNIEQRDPSFGRRLRAAGVKLGEPAPQGWRMLPAFGGAR